MKRPVMNFFTDASIVLDNNHTRLGGTYGFLRVNNDRDIKDEFAGFSLITNIQYLEYQQVIKTLLEE